MSFIKTDKYAKFYDKRPGRFTKKCNKIMLHSVANLETNPYRYITENGIGANGKVNYQICYNTDDGQYYKTIPDEFRGWHAGFKFNYEWYGICLPACMVDMEGFFRLSGVLNELKNGFGAERLYITLHRMVDENKKDPLSFYSDEMLLVGLRGPYLIPTSYRRWGVTKTIHVPAWEI